MNLLDKAGIQEDTSFLYTFLQFTMSKKPQDARTNALLANQLTVTYVINKTKVMEMEVEPVPLLNL